MEEIDLLLKKETEKRIRYGSGYSNLLFDLLFECSTVVTDKTEIEHNGKIQYLQRFRFRFNNVRFRLINGILSIDDTVTWDMAACYKIECIIPILYGRKGCISSNGNKEYFTCGLINNIDKEYNHIDDFKLSDIFHYAFDGCKSNKKLVIANESSINYFESTIEREKGSIYTGYAKYRGHYINYIAYDDKYLFVYSLNNSFFSILGRTLIVLDLKYIKMYKSNFTVKYDGDSAILENGMAIVPTGRIEEHSIIKFSQEA